MLKKSSTHDLHLKCKIRAKAKHRLGNLALSNPGWANKLKIQPWKYDLKLTITSCIEFFHLPIIVAWHLSGIFVNRIFSLTKTVAWHLSGSFVNREIMFSFLNALVAILNLSFARNFLGDYWEQITMCVCDVNSLSQWLFNMVAKKEWKKGGFKKVLVFDENSRRFDVWVSIESLPLPLIAWVVFYLRQTIPWNPTDLWLSCL